jgi:putative acetyltransferase
VPADVLVRADTPEDYLAIRRVNEEAFGGNEEADLIEALRAEGSVLLSLVAVEDEIVGHVLFSRMSIDEATRSIAAAALAPVAVRPDRQRRGIGGALIDEGLTRLRGAGERLVLVVGHPDYYPRFGFVRPPASSIEHPFPSQAFMALELQPGMLDSVRGRVCYPAAFGL